jgi:hypothetical protein
MTAHRGDQPDGEAARPDGGRADAPLFGDRPLDEPSTGGAPDADAEATTHRSPASAQAAPVGIFDDAPTEAIPVTSPDRGRHRGDADEGDVVPEWRTPRQTSRMTMVLLAALLIALGFFAGVLVGRSAGHTPSADNPRPAATSTARPGALG